MTGIDVRRLGWGDGKLGGLVRGLEMEGGLGGMDGTCLQVLGCITRSGSRLFFSSSRLRDERQVHIVEKNAFYTDSKIVCLVYIV
jgi:hypothetical protein